jgi:hypothetical protein
MMRLAGLLFGVGLLAVGQHAFAGCENSLNLEGTVTVDMCVPGDKCTLARSVLGDYMMTAAKKLPEPTLVMNMHASPWQLYDATMRIITLEEIADKAKANRQADMKQVFLMASWTGVTPDPNSKSIAEKLSDLLGGFPVRGMDGFLWIAKDGSLRATQQAFTITKPAKSPYGIRSSDEVMVSLVAGWYVWFEEIFITERDAEGMRRAAAGWDIFMLCPDKALELFEAAAQLSDSIAAYNAALIRFERGKDGDAEKGVKLLTQAARLGDKKAKTRLEGLQREKRNAGQQGATFRR